MSILTYVMMSVNACKIHHHSQTHSFLLIEIELSSRYSHPPNSPSLHSSSPQEVTQKCYSPATLLSPHIYFWRSQTLSTLACYCCHHQLLWRCWTWYPYTLPRLHCPRTFDLLNPTGDVSQVYGYVQEQTTTTWAMVVDASESTSAKTWSCHHASPFNVLM